MTDHSLLTGATRLAQTATSADCDLNPTTWLNCLSQHVNYTVSQAATNAFDQMCLSFAAAASDMLKQFGDFFVTRATYLDLTDFVDGDVQTVTTTIGMLLALLLLLGQVVRGALTHDGAPLAQGLVGTAKAALASLMTLGVANTALMACDDLSQWLIHETDLTDFGAQLAKMILVTGALPEGDGLLLVVALAVIVVVIVLWVQMFLRNLAVIVLVATAPIAAAGLVGATTSGWWRKLVAQTVQLLVLKPVIVLVFYLGMTIANTSSQDGDVGAAIYGLSVLAMAVFAWPMMARFFTFAEAGGINPAAVLGSLAQRASGLGGGTGGIGDLPQSDAARATERDTMNSVNVALDQSTALAETGTASTAATAATAATGVGLALLAGGKAIGAAKQGVERQMDEMSGGGGQDGGAESAVYQGPYGPTVDADPGSHALPPSGTETGADQTLSPPGPPARGTVIDADPAE